MDDCKTRDNIFIEGLVKFPSGMAQSDGIVRAGIVDDSIDASVFCNDISQSGLD